MTTRRRLHPVGPAQRVRILKRDNYICQYCFEGATEVDHIIPYSYISDNSDANLVASCGECNRLASNMVFDSFLDKYMYIKRRRQQRGNRRHSPVLVVRSIIDEVTEPQKEKVAKPVRAKVKKLPKPKAKPIKPPVRHRSKIFSNPTVSREFREMADRMNAEMDERLNLPPELREIFNRFRKPVRD